MRYRDALPPPPEVTYRRASSSTRHSSSKRMGFSMTVSKPASRHWPCTTALGNEVAAIAAYNAGAGAVSQWVAEASAAGHPLRVADIPYPETRAYVHRVMHLKAAYRTAYGDRLGPAS